LYFLTHVTIKILKISKSEIHPFGAKRGTGKAKTDEHTEGQTAFHYYKTSPNSQKIMENNAVCKETMHAE